MEPSAVPASNLVPSKSDQEIRPSENLGMSILFNCHLRCLHRFHSRVSLKVAPDCRTDAPKYVGLAAASSLQNLGTPYSKLLQAASLHHYEFQSSSQDSKQMPRHLLVGKARQQKPGTQGKAALPEVRTSLATCGLMTGAPVRSRLCTPARPRVFDGESHDLTWSAPDGTNECRALLTLHSPRDQASTRVILKIQGTVPSIL